jgi:hypothetical protein
MANPVVSNSPCACTFGAALTAVDEYISDENGELFLALNEDETPQFLYAVKGAYKICAPKASEKDGYILEL